jgi:hypothetical protein
LLRSVNYTLARCYIELLMLIRMNKYDLIIKSIITTRLLSIIASNHSLIKLNIFVSRINPGL